ncbi:MAG: FHA domain-containing protein [Woeseiaceae bacterium]
MELGAIGLREQPFRTHGRPAVFVAYEGQEKAFAFLSDSYAHNSGLALFQGPSPSGKTTILKQFAVRNREHCAVAVINGTGLDATEFLNTVLRKFGYEYPFESVNELLGLLKVFIRQQTATAYPPLLIVEDAHDMSPSALAVLCELASVRVREKFALKLVLASDRPINYIVRAPAMECMAKRLTGDFHLEPLTMGETNDYIYSKLRHAGCHDPDSVMPEATCDELYRASGGWPGVIDKVAIVALARAENCPVDLGEVVHTKIPARTTKDLGTQDETMKPTGERKHPLLYLTHNGKTLQKIKFEGSRLLIGRSAHNDVTIDSRFVSRHHTLLVRNGASTLLMDLNSANGTYVNSWRVSNQVLLNNDLITIGEHGLKFIDAAAQDRAALENTSFNDTVVMQSMEDMRRVLAREHTDIIPIPDQTSGSNADTA